MTANKYFEKNGKIYGVSSKYNSGWEHIVYEFDNMEKAQEWLNKDQCDFRERELMSKTSAIRLAGKKAVENAMTLFDD